MKVRAHSSLEPPLEYNQDQMLLKNQDSGLFNDLGSSRNIMHFHVKDT